MSIGQKFVKKYIYKFLVILLLINAAFSNITIVTAYAAQTVEMYLNYDGQTHLYSAEEIKLNINGYEFNDLAMPPIILNGYTLAPAREIFEMLGAVVDWKPDSREVYIGYGTSLVILQIDNHIANVNGTSMEMAVPPKIINDKTMIPIRFPSESLGFSVNWDGKSRTVTLYSPIPTNPEQINQSAQVPQTPQPTQPDISQAITNNEPGVIPVSYEESHRDAIDLTPRVHETVMEDERAKDISTGEIPEMNNPETTITNFTYNQQNQSFLIEASSPISKVSKNLLPDNRLFLDISNAVNALDSQYIIEGNPAVYSVRAAQNQVQPVKITRIVFDLQSSVSYSVSISQDRKSIIVAMKIGTVTDVSFSSNGNEDIITVDFINNPGVNTYILANPNSVVIDIPLSKMQVIKDFNVNGRFAAIVRASQADQNTGRVSVELKEPAMFNVSYSGNKAIIKIMEVSYKNISYDNATRTVTIRKHAGYPVNISQIAHNDQYGIYRYTLTMPGNYVDYIGTGEYIIKDNYLSSMVIQNDSRNNTEIVFHERQILAFDITEDNTYIYIRVMTPKEKYPKIVIVDPGHGGRQPGTNGSGLIEKDINLDIGLRLISLIEREGLFKVYATRTTDITMDNFLRAEFANVTGDMFVSVHINAADKNTTANGTEVIYYPHDNDSYTGMPSNTLADIIHRNLVAELGSNKRKVITDWLTVLTETTIPAVLCEIGFLTNPQEAALLSTENYRQKAAQGIYNGIKESFSQYNPRR